MTETTRRSTMLTFVGVLLALFLGALDQTIVATALPRIVRDLSGLDRYAWVATAYLLTSTVLIPIYGKLADMYNRKALVIWSIGLFLAGSFLCGLAGEFGPLPVLGDAMNQLIVFRGLQGFGNSGIFSLAFIVISDLFPPAERGRYQGFLGGTFGIANVLGPLVGGLLTDYGGAFIPGVAGWRWVFYVNAPFAVLALWFITTRMPPLHPKNPGEHRLSWLSAALLVLAVVPLILALEIDKTVDPWGGPVTLSLLAAALAASAAFIVHSRFDKNPVLDLSLFANRVFSLSVGASFFFGAAFLGTIIFLPLFMVNVLGVSATNTGLSIMPLSLGLFAGSFTAGQLVARVGHYRIILLAGGFVLLAGIVLLSLLSVHTTYLAAVLIMLTCGIGMGPSMALYTLAIQNAVDVRRIGQATSAGVFFRQIGSTAGLALLGTVLAAAMAASFARNLPAEPAGARLTTAAASPGRLMSEDGSRAAASAIRRSYDEIYALVARVVNSGDKEALARLLANPSVGESLRAELGNRRSEIGDQAADEFLASVKADLHRAANAAVNRLAAAIRLSFAQSIARLYFWVIFFELAAIALTFFIPELPLRKTLGRSEPDRNPGAGNHA